MPGILNLDGDLFARLEPCPVHLAQRGRGKGLLVELGEDVFRVVAQLVVHHFPQQRPVHRRHVVMQLLQRFDKLSRRDIGEIGQRLSDLHRGAAQVAHRVEQPQGRSPVRFRQQPLLLVGALEPSPQPVEQVGGGNLGLQRAQRGETPKSPDRNRFERHS